MSKIIVVYGGGFQPFHAGHFSSYIQAKEKFGKFPNTEFYVTASDNTNTRPIPFKEKQWLAKQAGVSEQDFRNVAVKSPLNPVEILSQYNPDQDIFILVRSERDPVTYNRKDGTPGYYQPFVNINKCKPFNSQAGGHGYVFVTQKEEFNLAGQTVYSGTQVRNMYASADNEMRNRIVKDMYPNSPNELMIRKVLDKYIGATDAQSVAPKTDTVVKPKTSAIKQLQANRLREQIQRMRPLIREATIEQKYKFLKLMKEATQLDELNLFRKKEEPIKSEPKNSPNDYRAYFTKQTKTAQKVYHSPDEYYAKTKLDPLKVKEPVKEGPTSDMRDFFKTQHPLNTAPIKPANTGPTIATVTRHNESEIDEARLHFTDPDAKINVYYIPPKLHREGKVQNLAHNIPYKLLEPFVDALLKKYKNFIPEHVVWHHVSDDPNARYGERIEESTDYLEEK